MDADLHINLVASHLLRGEFTFPIRHLGFTIHKHKCYIFEIIFLVIYRAPVLQ